MLPVSGESMALKVVPSCHPGTYFTVFMATVEQILTNVLYLQIPLKETGIFGKKNAYFRTFLSRERQFFLDFLG